MAKDHYIILGVSSDATLRQIRSAYRREARKSHPDHAGGGSEPFLAVQEAYDVLRDPERRRAYDRELARRRRAQHAARGERPEPLRRRRCPAEPLVPDQRSTGPLDSFWRSNVEPLFSEDDMRQPPSRTRAGRGGADIQAEIRLSRDQARRGGRVRVRIPLQVPCPTCHGRGGRGFFECLRCSGSGRLRGEYPVSVAFPAGIVDGDIGEARLRPPGLPDLSLRLLFRVFAW